MQAEAPHPGAIPAREAGDAVRGVPVTPQEAKGVSEGASGQPAGLPQFRTEYWGGQIVWLVVMFAALYLLLSRVFVPRLRRVRDERETAINGAIEDARRVRREADAQASAASAEMADARAKAQAAAAEAKARANAEAARRHAAQEEELANRLGEAEARIRASRDAAMGSVRQVASDTAGVIVEKLTGRAAAEAELAAALPDA
jgi:F-type H+-transporting ATPase subunit b